MPSGSYTIERPDGTVDVQCDMDNDGGGWTRAVTFDVHTGAPCPGEWVKLEDPPVCTRNTYDGQPPRKPIYSAQFDAVLSEFTEVRGYVLGLQNGSTDAFSPSAHSPVTIDDVYVDGVSITVGLSPRVHVWTYAAALTEDQVNGGACPCRQGVAPPAWVGDDYVCESANTGSWEYGHWYIDDPLWDTDSLDARCGSPGAIPWFHSTLDRVSAGPLELRIMANHNTHDEDVGIQRFELFVR